MDRKEILEGASKIIKDCFPELADEQFTEETALRDYSSIDSMGFILVITKIEGKFDVLIPEEKWDKISTMKELIDAVIENK